MNPFWCTVVILINIQLARCSSNTQLTIGKISPEKVYVSEGSNLTLYCEYNIKVPNCEWLRNGSSVSIRERYQYVSLNGTNTNDCTFTIKNVEKNKDDAQWQCIASATADHNGVESKKINVKFLSKPEIRWNGTKVMKLYAPWNDGMDVNLKCVSDSGIDNYLFWELDGKVYFQFGTSSSELTWKKWKSMQNQKEIKCVVEYYMNFVYRIRLISDTLLILQHTERKLNISVNGQIKSGNVKVKFKERNELKCESEGEPQPFYRWLHMNEDKDGSGALYVEGVFSNRQKIVPTKAGLYRCVAFDRLNETNVTSDIIITVLDSSHIAQMTQEVFIVISGIIVTVLTAIIVTCFFTIRLLIRSRVFRRSSSKMYADAVGGGGGGRGGQEEDGESPRRLQETLIPPPPSIPLPLLPPRSTSLMFLSDGASSLPSSPPSKRMLPRPPKLKPTTGYGGFSNTLGSSHSATATMRFGFQKAPQPLPRQLLFTETMYGKKQQQQERQQQNGCNSEYVMPDRPDLLPSSSSSERCHVGTDNSIYSTIVAFDNSR